MMALAGLWLVAGLSAADSSGTAGERSNYKVIFAEDFASAADPAWHLNHGTWKLVGGGWQGTELPKNHHAAAARYLIDFTDAVIEFDFRFDGAKMVSVTINDALEHVCRVQILPANMRVVKDDHDRGAGPDKAVVLASKKLDLQPDQWYHAVLEMSGSELTATVTGADMEPASAGGKDDLVATAKASFALVVTGQSATFRDLKVLAPAK
jgi:hypothetical protein